MLDPTAATIDRALAGIADGMDLLLHVTPTNAEEAWAASRAVGHGEEPDLRYRVPSVAPDTVRVELASLPVGSVDDPVVRRLLEDERTELTRQAALVEARGTPAFLAASHDLWGTADDGLLALAEGLLDRLPAPPPDVDLVPTDLFAARAEQEIARYREQLPGFAGRVEVRHDVPSLMVVQRTLIVGSDSWIPVHRAEALLHHEVGVHLLTAETGGSQPLTLLEHGLAGYEETQEALGVLAEHLVGGLDDERVRTLAGRVVAVRVLSDGGGFPDVFRELHDRWGFPEQQAWTIAMRVVRGGGLTKDVVYLRGVAELVEHLASGGDLSSLLVGKLHLDHLPDVEDLLRRGVLHPPTVHPRWLDVDGALARLEALGAGTAPVATWPIAVDA